MGAGQVPSDDVSMPELARWLRRVEAAIVETRQEIRDLNVVHMDVYMADRRADERRYKEIEDDVDALADSLRTALRTAVTALLFPLIVLVAGGLILAAVT